MEAFVQWTTAAPLWAQLSQPGAATQAQVLGAGDAFFQPAILRFASDEFMDEYLQLLENNPPLMAQYLAVRETWREPAPSPDPALTQPALPAFARRMNRLRLAAVRSIRAGSEDGSASLSEEISGPLKLYQPAQQRFYLVASCLVCQVAGLPDRILDTSNQERATFLVRRLRPKSDSDLAGAAPDPDTWPDQWDEYAFVVRGREAAWEKTASLALAPGEEQLPLFAVNFSGDDGRRRRLFSGLVPVGRREAYLGAPRRKADSETLPPDETIPEPPEARMVVLLSDVIQPWRTLLDPEARFKDALESEPPDDSDIDPEAARNALLKVIYDQVKLASWYILLDFADYLAQYLKNVWDQINGANLTLSDAEEDLILALENAFSGGISLKDALVDVVDFRTHLETITREYPNDPSNPNDLPWPDFTYQLSDSDLAALVTEPAIGLSPLETKVQAALADYPAPERMPALPLAAKPVMDAGETGWFVIRCVFERPNCGPFQPILLSLPTPVFEMASFFDPDAPGRPIRITMPLDTTPAGLRKFTKNTAFMLSDTLACQKERLGGLTLGDLVRSVLPWPLHKDLDVKSPACAASGSSGIGLICSLSIPIITICALILLMIIVSLLDLIFHWIPYFILCFPIPGLKAKKT